MRSMTKAAAVGVMAVVASCASEPVDKTRMLNSSISRVRTAVKFCVDEDGAVQATRSIVASPLPNCDARALRQVQGWRFHPI